MRIPSGCSKLSTSTIVDKVKGLIFGAILGDSLGIATEGLSRNEIEALYGKGPIRFGMDEEGKPFVRDDYRAQFDENDFGDDTEQILLLVETILGNNGFFHAKDFASRLKSYSGNGIKDIAKKPVGINPTHQAVLSNPNFHVDPLKAAVEVWQNTRTLRGANGALVRAPLLGVVKFWDGTNVIENTTDCCRITHPDPRCIVSCVIVSTLIARLLRGQELEIEIPELPIPNQLNTQDLNTIFVDQLETDYRLQALVRNVIETNKPVLTAPHLDPLFSTPETDLDQMQSYYVQLLNYSAMNQITQLNLDDADRCSIFKCLSVSLYCLTRSVPPQEETQYFKRIIMDVVMQGGEADTNATVVGSLLGARFGYSQLPTEWVVGLKRWEWLEDRVDEFCALL